MFKNIKVTLASFLLGALVGTAQAQTCGSTSNGISTNPTNATNPLCPNRVNTFDWKKRDWPIYWVNGTNPTNSAYSAFYNINECSDEATGLGSLRQLVDSDFQSADGWELLNTSIDKTTPTDFEYVALYNRYTSIIRLLFVTNENSRTINHKALKLAFNGYKREELTAMLWPAAREYGQAMDQKSNPAILQPTLAPNTNLCYMYFDIPVEYDPCTCVNQANTDIRFSMQNIVQAEISLYSRSLSQTRTVADIKANGQGNFAPKDFLLNVRADFDQLAGAGNSIFRSHDEMLGMLEKLGKERSNLEAQYAPFKLFNDVLEGASKFVPIADFLKKPLIGISNFLTSDPKDSLKLSGADAVKGILGASNYFGAPIKKKIDALGNRINALGTSTLTMEETVTKGTTTSTTEFSAGFAFRIPGGNTSLCDERIPYYNEVLGRFALLETPTVVLELLPVIKGEPIYINGIERYWLDRYHGRLTMNKSTIKYKFNPAANINKSNTKIYAALAFRKKGGLPPFSMLGISSFVPHGDLLISNLVPLECIEEQSWGELYYVNSEISSENTEVFLKLFVNYEFNGVNSQGNAPEAFQVYTYPVNINTVSVSSLSPRNLRASNYATTANTNNEILQNTSNTVIYEGMYSADINHNITPRAGQTVIFRAPVINVSPNVVLSPNVILEPITIGAGCSPLPETELGNFCSTTRYQGRVSDVKSLPADSGESNETPFTSTNLFVNVSPNPFSEALSIDYNLLKKEQVEITLRNMLGQTIQVIRDLSEQEAGSHKLAVEGGLLAPGVYFVNFKSETENKTIKVIKE